VGPETTGVRLLPEFFIPRCNCGAGDQEIAMRGMFTRVPMTYYPVAKRITELTLSDLVEAPAAHPECPRRRRSLQVGPLMKMRERKSRERGASSSSTIALDLAAFD
jgi:hypothetical protein